jgi:hypothetical protein
MLEHFAVFWHWPFFYGKVTREVKQMTLDEFQSRVHALYEQDSDSPSSGEEDYTVRTTLANDAINVWETENGVLWNELFTTLDDASDGDTTTTADTSAYDAPSDFKFPVGFVKITDASTGGETFYEQIRPEDSGLDWDEGDKFYYVTGNKSSGYKIHLNPTPDSTGDEIDYEYYKEASELSATTDEFEMSDPGFAVYWTLNKLQAEEGRGGMALQVAMEKLRGMKTKNMMTGFNQDKHLSGYYTETGFGK